MTQLAQAPGAGTTWTAADLGGVTTAIKTTLHPVATIEKPLAAQAGRCRRRPAADRPARAGDGGTGFPAADVRAAGHPRARVAAARPGPDDPGRRHRRCSRPTGASSSRSWSGLTTSWPASCSGTATRPTSAAPTSAASGTSAGRATRRRRHRPDPPVDGAARAEPPADDRPAGAAGARRADPPLPQRRRVRRPGGGGAGGGARSARAPTRSTRSSSPSIEPDIALFGFDIDPAAARADPG